MSKLWEYMSRDEKLDYMRERLDSIDASLGELARLYRKAMEERGEPALPALNIITRSD